MTGRSKLLILGLFAAIILVGSTGVATAAIQIGNYWFEVVKAPDGITWDQAHAEANAVLGELAVVDNEDLNKAVAALVLPEHYTAEGLGPWLGGYQNPDGDPWSWLTTVNTAPAVFPQSGEPWYGGQPDQFMGPPQGLLYYNGGAKTGHNWGDFGAANNEGGLAQPIAYIVQWDHDPNVPEPTALVVWSLLGFIGLGGAAWRRRRTQAA